MNIKLYGIPGLVFGGYFCLRGYASILDLASVSEAKEYQRDINIPHQKEIIEFYKSSNYQFFPEIILACEVEDFQVLGKQPQDISINQKGIKYRYFVSYSTGELEVDTKNTALLHRIDGNHRLNAFEELNSEKFKEIKLNIEESNFKTDQKVPFCVLFFPKGERDKDIKAIFNNINFKAKPLQLEENLRNIFDETGAAVFEDFELKKDFGLEYYESKVLISQLESSGILEKFKKCFPNYREACFRTIKFIQETGKLEDEFCKNNNLIKIIEEFIFTDFKNINLDLGIFIALLWINLYEKDNYHYFLNWIKKYKITELNNLNPCDLINIYNNIISKTSKRIFISMPFDEDDCEDFFESVKEVVKEINGEYNTDIQLPLRIDELQKSYSYQIIDEILDNIEKSGYLIALLNRQRQNVYHEIGYAMGYIKGKNLNENVLLAMKKPKNAEVGTEEFKVHFNLTGYHRVEYNNSRDLKSKLKQKIILHYKLK